MCRAEADEARDWHVIPSSQSFIRCRSKFIQGMLPWIVYRIPFQLPSILIVQLSIITLWLLCHYFSETQNSCDRHVQVMFWYVFSTYWWLTNYFYQKCPAPPYGTQQSIGQLRPAQWQDAHIHRKKHCFTQFVLLIHRLQRERETV